MFSFELHLVNRFISSLLIRLYDFDRHHKVRALRLCGRRCLVPTHCSALGDPPLTRFWLPGGAVVFIPSLRLCVCSIQHASGQDWLSLAKPLSHNGAVGIAPKKRHPGELGISVFPHSDMQLSGPGPDRGGRKWTCASLKNE